MTNLTPLSPAAQAVLDAFLAEWADDFLMQDQFCLAAALRAAADQVVPENSCFESTDAVRDALLAIAAELEGAS